MSLTKILLVIALAITNTTAFATAKAVKQPKSCGMVMKEAKKVGKKDLFVAFATKDVSQKLRKDFPDLRTQHVRGINSCTWDTDTESSPTRLLLLTIPNTLANIQRLRAYEIKNAG